MGERRWTKEPEQWTGNRRFIFLLPSLALRAKCRACLARFAWLMQAKSRFSKSNCLSKLFLFHFFYCFLISSIKKKSFSKIILFKNLAQSEIRSFGTN